MLPLPPPCTLLAPSFSSRPLRRSLPRSAGLALFLFTSLEALPIFMEERSIYTREHSRGAYRVLSYSLTNFLIYLPVCLTLAVVFTSISYFMVSVVALCFPRCKCQVSCVSPLFFLPGVSGTSRVAFS